MAAIALWRWVLLDLLARPVVGFLWLLLLAGQPLLLSLGPMATSRSALEIALDWTFVAGLLGTTLGLTILSRSALFLGRLDPRTRFQGELGALMAAAMYLQLPILLGALGAGAALHDLGGALPAILTVDLHLAGISLLLLLPTLSTALRVCVLLAAAWLLPALFSADASLVRVSALLDAGAALRTGASGVLRALALAAALACAAYLLRTSPARSRVG